MHNAISLVVDWVGSFQSSFPQKLQIDKNSREFLMKTRNSNFSVEFNHKDTILKSIPAWRLSC